jgi:Amt family ammonium transporter
LIIDSPYDYEIAALAVTNTTLSAGVAGITALFVNMIILERLTGRARYDLSVAMNAVLTGLVGITGGCGLIEPWAAVIVGIISGIVYLGGSRLLILLRLDDAVDAIPVHLGGGIWGLISVGLFASPSRMEMAYGNADHVGFFHSVFDRFHDIDGTLLGAQIVGVLFIIGWNVAIMMPFFVILDYHNLFRSDAMDELMGLDKSFHGGTQDDGEDALSPDTMAALEKRLMKTMKRNRRGGTEDNYSRTYSNSNGQEQAVPGSIQVGQMSVDDSMQEDYVIPLPADSE